MRTLVWITAIAAICAALVLAPVALMFWEPQDMARGSIAYRLTVPAELRSLDPSAPCGPPRYSVETVVDGLSPGRVTMHYPTRHPGPLASLAAIPELRACAIAHETASELVLTCPFGTLEFIRQPVSQDEQACHPLTIRMIHW